MKIARFSAILEAYGATPARWPERERDDALTLARSSVVAARALAEARELDEALMAFDTALPACERNHFAALRFRIVAAARPLSESWAVRWFGVDIGRGRLWPSLAGLGFATVLGFAVGLGGLMQAEGDREGDDGSVVSTIDLAVNGQVP